MPNRWAMWLGLGAIGLFAVARNAGSQEQTLQPDAKKHVVVPVMAPRAEDVSSIDGIVKATYETISGGVGVSRQWGRDRTLYVPGIRFVALEPDPKAGALKTHVSTHQEYVDEEDASFVKDGFTERELGRETHRFGNIATVLSSYEGKVASGKVVARGVQIYQLYNDGKRWWIASLEWNEESPANPIPPELLLKK